MLKRLRALRRDITGAMAVEAGFVFVIAIPFVIGLVEFGNAYWSWNSLQLAAQQGARWAMVHAGASSLATCTAPSPAPTITGCSSVTPAALPNCAAYQTNQSLIGFPAASVSITVTCAGSSPTTLTVGTSYTFNLIAPALLPYGPLNLSGTAKVPLL